jgi:tetratricopeptide (TPR) repeat protein
MSLLAFLLRGERSGISARTLRKCLQHPWGFPAAPPLRALAEACCPAPSATLATGDALLVGIDGDGLFRLGLTDQPPDALELRGSAAESARLAHRLVPRDLPVFSTADGLHRAPRWLAGPFALPATGTPPTALDGASFGLSLALATASHLLDLPMQSTLVASAALHLDGSLGTVDGIARKVRLVMEHAPGITTFLVAAGQEHEAERARAQLLGELGLDTASSWLRIVPVTTFAEAFAHAFPDALDALRARFRDPAVAERIAAELHRLALFDTPLVLGWRAVVTCAIALARAVQRPETRARLDTVRRIAERHAGEGQLMPWPDDAELRTLPRALRLRLLAHVVQSAADAGVDAHAHARRALRLVRPPLERAAEDAVLLGAAGRALAAAGNEAEAIVTLREATQAWSEIACPHESSHALCELLRLLGMRGQHDEVLALCAGAATSFLLDPRSPEKSIGYLRVAAGRAMVQVALPEKALDYLDDDGRWPPLPASAEGARERWRARALDAVGRSEEAARCRRTLDARSDRGPALAFQAGLAQLDRARRTGQDTIALVAALALLPEGRRTRDRLPPGDDLEHALAERTRY